MTKTPKWLPDGSGIDPESLPDETVVETEHGDWMTLDEYELAPGGRPAIISAYTNITPPKPDPRVEILAKALHDEGRCLDPFGTCGSTSEHYRDAARELLATLDAMGADQ